MKPIKTAIFPVALALLIAGCGGSGSGANSNPPPPPPVVNATPRLEAGPHLGFIFGFDALSPAQMALADSSFAQAVSAGQQVNRVQLDWRDLEPQPGVFDTVLLTQQLDYTSRSQQSVYVLVSMLGTGSLVLPDDLMSADRSTAATGLTLDGPEIRVRYRAFVDWLIPELAAYNVWALSISNEPTTNFGAISRAEITNFLTESADYARGIDADLAITVTTASATTDTDVLQFLNDLMPHLDIAMFNYYCLDPETLQATDATRWVSDITMHISTAMGRDIFYQELGCPTGYADLGGSAVPPAEVIGSSVATQEAFFRFMVDKIVARDQLRGAFVFQLFDWSPQLTQLIIDSLGGALGNAAVPLLREWLMTVGMCRWSDNVCREAWNIFLDGVTQTANVRAAMT